MGQNEQDCSYKQGLQFFFTLLDLFFAVSVLAELIPVKQRVGKKIVEEKQTSAGRSRHLLAAAECGVRDQGTS